MANPLAAQLFAVGQMVGKDGANFQYQGGGGYHGQAPNPTGGQGGGASGASAAGGLLGQALANRKTDPGAPMQGGALVSGDINNAEYSNNYSLGGAAKADNTQYGLMGQPQTGLGAGMQYNAAPATNPYAVNTQGLNYQQPSSGWGGLFD